MRSSARVPSLSACLLASAALLVSGHAAYAATLSLVLDQTTVASGDTVTLRLIGDSQGAVDHSLYAGLTIDPAALLDVQIQTFLPPTDDSPWTQGYWAGKCFSATECSLLNAIHFPNDVGVDASLEPFTYAVLTATAGAAGTWELDFSTVPTRSVNFFGLISGSGTTLYIHNPEPGTGMLLALGLGALALARRRRS
jgi:hypothetical protein